MLVGRCIADAGAAAGFTKVAGVHAGAGRPAQLQVRSRMRICSSESAV